MTVVKKLIAICLVAAFLIANIGCGGGTPTKAPASTGGADSGKATK